MEKPKSIIGDPYLEPSVQRHWQHGTMWGF